MQQRAKTHAGEPTDFDTMMEDHRLYETARARMDAGALEEAIELFRSSAQVTPHFKTLELLGECQMRLRRFTDAVVPLAAATALNRQSRAPALLAEVFEQLGQLDDAADMANVALSRDANHTRAQAVLLRIKRQR